MAIKIRNAYPPINPVKLSAGEVFVDLRPDGRRTYLKAEVNGQPYAVLLDSAPKQDTPSLVMMDDLNLHHAQLAEGPELVVDPGPLGVAVPGDELKNGTVIVAEEGNLICVATGASKLFFDLATGVAGPTPRAANSRHQVWRLTATIRGAAHTIAESADDGSQWD